MEEANELRSCFVTTHSEQIKGLGSSPRIFLSNLIFIDGSWCTFRQEKGTDQEGRNYLINYKNNFPYVKFLNTHINTSPISVGINCGRTIGPYSLITSFSSAACVNFSKSLLFNYCTRASNLTLPTTV